MAYDKSVGAYVSASVNDPLEENEVPSWLREIADDPLSESRADQWNTFQKVNTERCNETGEPHPKELASRRWHWLREAKVVAAARTGGASSSNLPRPAPAVKGEQRLGQLRSPVRRQCRSPSTSSILRQRRGEA